ncbi:thioredoxin domain-containing protein [Moorella naiadis]|uniref:DsbA family protein n=1 Tax=Moorella naiadis (nom. illeg.) TaxID=3093670 RepID=UPI003D9CB71A
MKSILQPGIKAPQFTLPAVNQEYEVSVSGQLEHVTAILFFGSEVNNEIAGQLTGFQERLQDFEKHNAMVIAISDAAPGDLRKLAEKEGINFPFIADSEPRGYVARSFGVVSNENIQPAVFIVDQEGLIRRVYCPEPGKDLPNPAMVLRAIIKLANTPKPPLVTPEDWRLGSPEAPVILIEYGDYQCGHCRQLYQVIRKLLPLYEEKVQFVFRHYPLRHLHPQAELAAEAAEAAGAQGKFWEMHARMFEAENALERENLVEYAREIGLDIEKFTQDLDNHRFANEVKEDFRGATRNKIKFPPAFFINYIFFDEPPTEETIRARIDSLLACLA